MSISPLQILKTHAQSAMQTAGCGDFPAIVQTASKSIFGDFQINGAMGAAKSQKTNPRILATALVSALQQSGIEAFTEKCEIAGAGFINLHLRNDWIESLANRALQEKPERLGIAPIPHPLRILVDYSSPNLAKEMHVGHLRSTIIGDALARIFDFLGHRVVRCNHVGDWGTQFGMLVAHYVDQSHHRSINLQDLEDFYRSAKARFDNDPTFAERAREYVVKLQSGDNAVLAHWRAFLALSLTHAEAVYQRLGVLLNKDDVRGESAYNNDLAQVVADLRTAGLIREDRGALVAFLDEIKNPEGNPSAVIIQKNDGGYLYTTTDLAAIRYRHRVLQIDRALYVVDARQSLHFQQLFALARQAGFAPASMQLEHIAFGTVMGEDGKPFKTRSGDTIKLMDLLENAQTQALALVRSKQPTLDETELRTIAHAVGIGAVKYADLSKSRQSDYVFSLSSMLSMEGNTAPYLMYAYARVQSVFRKAEHYSPTATISIKAPQERALVLHLLQCEDVLHDVAHSCQPHHLCGYLYQVATLYSKFYESCPILKSEHSQSRLQISALTARTLRVGLNLLGINVLDTM